MESYRTEEEQVEAIRRWWSENGTSTIIAVVLALATGFGWQAWQDYDKKRTENASYVYQSLLENLNGDAVRGGELAAARELAEQLKNDYASTSYAQFAALHLAKLAVTENDPVEAQAQLRWVLAKAPGQSDIADIAQLRLARILASSGDVDQALDILEQGKDGPYAASYAISMGDIYMQSQRYEEARRAYARAKLTLSQSPVDGRIATLEYKIQSLNPVPARAISVETPAVSPDTEATSEEQED